MTAHELQSTIEVSPRVLQVRGMFDLDDDHGTHTVIEHEPVDLDQPWNVGLIVGPSGTGKSTAADRLFGITEPAEHNPTAAVLDLFPDQLDTDQITGLLTSVGFSSPPAWLRPIDALSVGERFRVETALALAQSGDKPVCLDEFTSVVDRTVAQVGSNAVAKHVRRENQQLVAVSCHYDIADWLQPDWTLDMLDGSFTWGSVQPRPQVKFAIKPCDRSIWRTFSRHHYLSDVLASHCRSWLGTINGIPAALLAEMRQPHAKAKNIRRCSRIVVTPDFQGLGLGRIFLDTLGAAYRHERERFTITTSHPGMIATLNRSQNWAITHKGRTQQHVMGAKNLNTNIQYTETGRKLTTFQTRRTMSFEYAGTTSSDYHDQLLGKTSCEH